MLTLPALPPRLGARRAGDRPPPRLVRTAVAGMDAEAASFHVKQQPNPFAANRGVCELVYGPGREEEAVRC